MADVLTAEQRRYNMSRIRGRDTRPEMLVRQGLHARGLRFRLHRRDLPGRPDLVFPRYRVAMFVHGCFWHGHNCPMFTWPRTRREFWQEKITKNRGRDRRTHASLKMRGWRVLTVWECALRGPGRWAVDEVLEVCEAFAVGGTHGELVIRGAQKAPPPPGEGSGGHRGSGGA